MNYIANIISFLLGATLTAMIAKDKIREVKREAKEIAKKERRLYVAIDFYKRYIIANLNKKGTDERQLCKNILHDVKYTLEQNKD